MDILYKTMGGYFSKDSDEMKACKQKCEENKPIANDNANDKDDMTANNADENKVGGQSGGKRRKAKSKSKNNKRNTKSKKLKTAKKSKK
jgi:hypothetical protein